MRDGYLGLRINKKLKIILQVLAAQDKRTISNYCCKVLEEHAQTKTRQAQELQHQTAVPALDSFAVESPTDST